MRVLLDQFLSDLRSASYQLTAQWHQDGVWIAEALATYEMRDWLRLERLPRVFVVEAGADGISAVRVYGANERPLERLPDRRRVIPRWRPSPPAPLRSAASRFRGYQAAHTDR